MDPAIVAMIGPPPQNVDLDEQMTLTYGLVVCAIFGLALATVALRWWVRVRIVDKIGWDDYAIVGSVVCTGATVAMALLAGHLGAGKHIWRMQLSGMVTLMKCVYAEQNLYALAVTSAKASVLLLYRRIFTSKAGSTRAFTYMYWSAVFLAAAYPVTLWITLGCSCRPLSVFWNRFKGQTGTCIDVKTACLALGVVNLFNDVVILAVPVPRIFKLQMSLKMKLTSVAILMLGGVVCIASAFRIYYLHAMENRIDGTWWMGPSFAWSSIEPSLGIVSACLPTLGPLFRLGRHKSTYRYASTQGSKRRTYEVDDEMAPRPGNSDKGRREDSDEEGLVGMREMTSFQGTR